MNMEKNNEIKMFNGFLYVAADMPFRNYFWWITNVTNRTNKIKIESNMRSEQQFNILAIYFHFIRSSSLIGNVLFHHNSNIIFHFIWLARFECFEDFFSTLRVQLFGVIAPIFAGQKHWKWLKKNSTTSCLSATCQINNSFVSFVSFFSDTSWQHRSTFLKLLK